MQGRTYPVTDKNFEWTVRSECVSGEGAKVRIAAPRAFRSRQVAQGWNLMELVLRHEFEEGRRERPNDPHTWTAEPPRARFTQTSSRLRYRGPA